MNEIRSGSRPEFKEALKLWFKLGWISFGGTAGHIALMHDFLVDQKKWISNRRFFHALSLCSLTPHGPLFGPPGYEINLLYIAGLISLMLTGRVFFLLME